MAATLREILARLDERSESMCERIDEIKDDVKTLVSRSEDHEIRLVRLEVAPKQEKNNERWTRVFTALGAFLAGVFGGKLT